MKKKEVAFLITLALMLSSVFPAGIVAYDGDIAAENMLDTETTIGESSADVVQETDENIDPDAPQGNVAANAPQENETLVDEIPQADDNLKVGETQTDESVQLSENEVPSDEFADEIIMEDAETDEIMQDISAEDGAAENVLTLGGDVGLSIDDIEVMDEATIQTMTADASGLPTLSIENPISYELTAANSSLTYDINVEPGDYVIYDNNYNTLSSVSVTLYKDGYYMLGCWRPQSFTVESGVRYSVEVSALLEDSDPSVRGTLRIEKKKKISSVEFLNKKSSFDVFETLDNLDLPAKITYEDGTEETIGADDWDYDFVGDVYGYHGLKCDTQSGNTVYVLFYRDGQLIDMAGNNNSNLLSNMLPVGIFSLKVSTSKSIGTGATVENIKNGTITITPPSSDGKTEITSIPETYSIENNYMSKSYYYMSAQENEKALHVTFDEGGDNGISLCDFIGKSVNVFVYGKKDNTDDLYLLSENDLFDTAYQTPKRDAYCRLDKGKEYWVVLNGYDNVSSGTPIRVTLSLEEPQSVISVSITGINASCNVSDINHELLENLRVHVKYGAEADTEDISNLYVQGDIDGDGFNDCIGETKYQDTVIVKLKNSDGSIIDFPNDSNIIVPGTYKLIACIKETGLQSEEQSFTVEGNGVPALVPNQEYSIDFSVEEDWKLFSFTPKENVKCVFSLSQWGNCEVALYDSSSHLICKDSNAITDHLEKGQTYYYCVYSNYSEICTMAKLAEFADVTAVTLESPPKETVYEIEYDEWYDCYYVDAICEGMKVRVHYSDGSSQVIDIDGSGKEDKFGNYIVLGICPLNVDGSPNRNKIKGLWEIDPNEMGNYALLVRVAEGDEDDELYLPIASEWVNIVIVPKGHVHSWNVLAVEIEPTCTTEGKQSVCCSSCGAMSTMPISKLGHSWSDPIIEREPTCAVEGKKLISCKRCGVRRDDSTTTIPKLEHSWSDWSIAAQGEAVLARTCRVCHEVETKNFSPVLSLTAEKLTMKTKQSTTKFKVTAMAEYDSLVSVESNNTKILKVSNIAADGTFKLKAQKKTGTAKLTITLKSGATKTVVVKVQREKVKTTKISGLQKKLSLKVKQKVKLTPVVMPVTSQDKIKYTSSNKKVAVITSKGQITAKKKGTATITVESGTKKVKIKVTVK